MPTSAPAQTFATGPSVAEASRWAGRIAAGVATGASWGAAWLGGWNAFLIFGNKLAPAVGDWYLARTGFDSQFTDEPADPERPHNLWSPLCQDFGARGRFDARARRRSLQLTLTRRRGVLLFALAALAAAALGVLAL